MSDGQVDELMQHNPEVCKFKNCARYLTIDEAEKHGYCPVHLIEAKEHTSFNVGKSDYAKHKIQPWAIWEEYNLNPWDADIVKRVLRTKEGESREMEYEKIIHVCQERLRQLRGE